MTVVSMRDMIAMPKSLAIGVFGDMSPYPTVDTVVITKYKRLMSRSLGFSSSFRPLKCFESIKYATTVAHATIVAMCFMVDRDLSVLDRFILF